LFFESPFLGVPRNGQLSPHFLTRKSEGRFSPIVSQLFHVSQTLTLPLHSDNVGNETPFGDNPVSLHGAPFFFPAFAFPIRYDT